MKVTGAGPTASTDKTRRAARPGAKGGFADHLSEAMDDVGEALSLSGPAALSGVDALLAAQATDETTDREARQRLLRHGEDILDRLEEVRHGLLLGMIPKERLLDLARMVRARRDSIGDPRLAALLDEIELRAEVELAKLAPR